jgi:hypothetical protein
MKTNRKIGATALANNSMTISAGTGSDDGNDGNTTDNRIDAGGLGSGMKMMTADGGIGAVAS